MKKFFCFTTILLVSGFSSAIVLGFFSDNGADTIVLTLPQSAPMGEGDSWQYSDSNLIRYTYSDFECLVANVFYEARNQHRNGQIMVASVTLNRVTMKQYPNSICGVMKHKSRTKAGTLKQGGCSFSWVCDRNTKKPNLDNSIERKAWGDAVKVAIYALQHDTEVLKSKLTHYHTKAVKPSWSDNMRLVGVVGDHITYTVL